MNHQELEAIRDRDRFPQDSSSRGSNQARADRTALLVELDRKWRAVEKAEATIAAVRQEVTNLEDAEKRGDRPGFAGRVKGLARIREIVGPR